MKERIAALEQRTATPAAPPSVTPTKPTSIPQLTTNVHLRDKIAKFERKGGVPVPRGRFGMGAPPVDSGKPKKQGELYGNRMPRMVSAGVPAHIRPAPATPNNRRSISLFVPSGDDHPDYDFSTPRSNSPCPSDIDTNSDGLFSPDASKTSFSPQPESPSTPPSELADVLEGEIGVPAAPGNVNVDDLHEEKVPSSEAVTPVIVPESIQSPEEDSDDDEENVTTPSLPHEGEIIDYPASIPSAPTAEETEVDHEAVASQPEPEQEVETEASEDKTHDFVEAASVVEETPSPPLSRSSSLCTLTPVPRVEALTATPDSVPTIRPDVPTISLSPPLVTEEVVSPAVPSPREPLSPQESERSASPVCLSITSSPREFLSAQESERSASPVSPTITSPSGELFSPKEGKRSASPVGPSITSSPRELLSPQESERSASPVGPSITSSPRELLSPQESERSASPASPSITSLPRELLSPQEGERSASPVSPTMLPLPRERFSPQESEGSASPVSPSVPSPVASPSLASSGNSSPVVDQQSQLASPVERTERTPSPARSFGRASPARKRFSEIVVPSHGREDVPNNLSHATQADVPSQPTMPIKGVPKFPSHKEYVQCPTVTITSPAPATTTDSPPPDLAYSLADNRASKLSPTSSAASHLDMSSPTSKISLDVQSPASASPDETLPSRAVAPTPTPTPARSIPAALTLSAAAGHEPNGLMSPPRSSPLSATSRFKHTPKTATTEGPNAFRAVVRNKVREPATALPSSQFLAPQIRQSARIDGPLAPGTGELATLLEEAALLEHALTQGELDLSLNLGAKSAGVADQDQNKHSGERRVDREDGRRNQRRGASEPPTPSGEEGDAGSLKSRLAFRLPLKKKTKYWKASSIEEELRAKRSLETERSLGLSIPDPSFLKRDPAAGTERVDEAQPRTPTGFRKDVQHSTPPKSPRLIATLMRFASSGSTKSLHTSGTHPRYSTSTTSELSSEDSMLVATPPDANSDVGRSLSLGRMYSHHGHGSNVPWPSASPKRTLARAASFAEKILNRSRTKSNGSTMSAQEPRAGQLSASRKNVKAASSSNLSMGASYKLDIPSLAASESLFDSPTLGSPSFTLPNPYSPSSPSSTRSPPTPAIASRLPPRSLGDNESWVSEVSQLDPELFDAFPSVPQHGVPALRPGAQRKPQTNPDLGSSFDPFFMNPPRAATMPKRNTTIVPSHAVDSGFLGLASTAPNRPSTADHRYIGRS